MNVNELSSAQFVLDMGRLDAPNRVTKRFRDIYLLWPVSRNPLEILCTLSTRQSFVLSFSAMCRLCDEIGPICRYHAEPGWMLRSPRTLRSFAPPPYLGIWAGRYNRGPPVWDMYVSLGVRADGSAQGMYVSADPVRTPRYP